MSSEIKVEFINNYMTENNLSKTAFCYQCKISNSTLNKILTNDYNFSIIVLFKIARVLNVRIHELFS